MFQEKEFERVSLRLYMEFPASGNMNPHPDAEGARDIDSYVMSRWPQVVPTNSPILLATDLSALLDTGLLEPNGAPSGFGSLAW